MATSRGALRFAPGPAAGRCELSANRGAGGVRFFHYEEQPDAIVRAMSWDRRSVARKNGGSPAADASFTIPAKSVRVPH